jgi:hypothetical protein
MLTVSRSRIYRRDPEVAVVAKPFFSFLTPEPISHAVWRVGKLVFGGLNILALEDIIRTPIA